MVKGSEYQIKCKKNFQKYFETERGRYRGAHSLRFFEGRLVRAWKEGEEQGLQSPWWQGSRLPTADRFTDITVGACAGIYPSGAPTGWKYL